MRQEIADSVYPVFRYGLQLRKRLRGRRAEELELTKALDEVTGHLNQTPKAAEREFFGDGSTGDLGRSVVHTTRVAEGYLGIRYALACWIDEIMIQDDMPWMEEWNNHKRETALYGSNERAWRFWEQAERAARRSPDALEVFYLCVVLGFRGKYVDEPQEAQARRKQWEDIINEGRSYKPPLEQTVISRHEPLTGAKRKQTMLLAATVTGLAAIVVGVFAVAFFFLSGR